MTDDSVELSLRAVVDYVAGRIDREMFEQVVHPDWLGMLRQHLSNGAGVSAVSIERHPNTDDDGLVIHFGKYDTAAAPFRPTSRDEVPGDKRNDS